MTVLVSLVQDKLDTLPPAPGVYLFKDRNTGVLYIGKAQNLRSRVRSYFLAGVSDERFFVPFLAEEVHDLETYVVGNEKEAALLENELDQAAPASLQHQAPRRQRFSLHTD